MKPPVAPSAGNIAAADIGPPAVSICLNVLRKRADFLRAAKALRRSTKSIHVQARNRETDEDRTGIYVGYTCSKKVGNAVARNRAKRRLRAVARRVLPEIGKWGWDYVLIGRANVTASYPFDEMCTDLKSALAKLHQDQP